METTEVEVEDDPHEAIDVNVEGGDVDNRSTEANESTSVAIVKHPSHLQTAEKELLISCTHDKAFRKRSGKLDWEKIENVFAEKANCNTIFNRKRKRLRSTSKHFNLHHKVLGSCHINAINEVTCNTNDSDVEGPLPTLCVSNEERPLDVDNVRQDLIVSKVEHYVEPQRRLGDLDDLERNFVREHGKKCLRLGGNVDNNRMLKEYKSAFPGFSRQGDALKNYWNNWKKDSSAYKEFISSIKK